MSKMFLSKAGEIKKKRQDKASRIRCPAYFKEEIKDWR